MLPLTLNYSFLQLLLCLLHYIMYARPSNLFSNTSIHSPKKFINHEVGKSVLLLVTVLIVQCLNLTGLSGKKTYNATLL